MVTGLPPYGYKHVGTAVIVDGKGSGSLVIDPNFMERGVVVVVVVVVVVLQQHSAVPWGCYHSKLVITTTTPTTTTTTTTTTTSTRRLQITSKRGLAEHSLNLYSRALEECVDASRMYVTHADSIKALIETGVVDADSFKYLSRWDSMEACTPMVEGGEKEDEEKKPNAPSVVTNV